MSILFFYLQSIPCTSVFCSMTILKSILVSTSTTSHSCHRLDRKVFFYYACSVNLYLNHTSCRDTGSSNLNTHSLICGRGLPLHVSSPTQSYITRFWSLNKPFQDLPDYVDVDFETYHTATVLESRTIIESGTTGFRTWFASYVLSQYLIVHPGIFVNLNS